MSLLVVMDTSVLLNILNVPGNNERHQEVMARLSEHIEAGDSLFLPMATILETGNHIADIKAGGSRRQWGASSNKLAWPCVVRPPGRLSHFQTLKTC